MKIHDLKDLVDAMERGDTVSMAAHMTHFASLVEIARIADLVNAEFKSDPMSVQCFSISAIVEPLNRELLVLEAL